MNAFDIFRLRRFLPPLVISFVLGGPATVVRADQLTSGLSDRAPLAPSDLSARVVFSSRPAEQRASQTEADIRCVALAALSLTLFWPAGTTSYVPPPPDTGTTSGGGTTGTDPTTGGGTTGGPHISNITTTGASTSGGPPPNISTPEPASLMLALTGSGTALLSWFLRRRQPV